MSTANKVLIHRWFEEVWNKKRESAIYEMLHPQAVLYGLSDSPTGVLRGPDGFLPFWRKFTLAVPNITVAVESVLAEDDKVAARCSVRGKHTGEGLAIPPTGAQLSFHGMGLAHLKDGRIVEAWNSFDFLLLYQQLGMVRFVA